jgi:hypothetical protein
LILEKTSDTPYPEYHALAQFQFNLPDRTFLLNSRLRCVVCGHDGFADVNEVIRILMLKTVSPFVKTADRYPVLLAKGFLGE